MKKFVRLMAGFLQIRLTGAFPERFLNLCGTEQLPFWDSERPEEGVILVTVPLWEEKRSKVLAQKAFCDMEILQRRGLPIFLCTFRKRFALIGGMIFAFLGAVILSGFILVVDVTGNFSIPDSVILTELNRLGFGLGSYGPAVNVRDLSNRALMELPELSFLTINISGVRAEVVVREGVAVPETEQRWDGGDITAAADGIILDIEPIVGRVQVQEGEAVLKGEVLISGTEEHRSGDGTGRVLGVTKVRAEGRVMAQTRRVLRAATPLTVTVKGAELDRKTVWSLKILKKSVKFDFSSRISQGMCDKITSEYTPVLPQNIRLPISLVRTTVTAYSEAQRQAERSSVEGFLQDTLERRLTTLIGEEGQILSRRIAFTERDGVLTAELEAACIEQIGRLVPHQTN